MRYTQQMIDELNATGKLRETDFSNCDLSNLSLKNANLEWASLWKTNLTGANLSCANLENINIRYCIGNQKEICNISGYFWRITFTKDILAIGCKQYSIDEWRKFTDEEINAMEDDALEFWTENKDTIFKEIDKHFGR